MADKGPIAKRSDQRRRVNKPTTPVVKAPGYATVEVPEPDPGWHPIASRWFASLAKSGQSAFYDNSDWMTAWALAESMSREFKPQPVVVSGKCIEMHELPPKAASLSSWFKGMSGLLVTEGDRRRAGLELQHPTGDEEEEGDVSELSEYRNRLRESG